MSEYQDNRMKTFKLIKGIAIGILSAFSAILLALGLFMVIYQYDNITIVFGIILIILSVFVFTSDFLIIKFWKSENFVKSKYEEDFSMEIEDLEKRIEEIKKKNNIV